jgi:hypothetical protein
MSLKIMKPMGAVVCHDVFPWHPHPNPPTLPHRKGEGAETGKTLKGRMNCVFCGDMKQSQQGSSISRLVLILQRRRPKDRRLAVSGVTS